MVITITDAVVEDFSTPTATSHTQNLSNANAGDVRVVVIAANPDGTGTVPTINLPSGWTALGTQTNHGAASDGMLWAIYRVVQGGDGGTVTITTTQTCMMATICTTYIGVDNSTPIDVTTPTYDVTENPPTSPAITTVTDGARIIYATLVDGAPGFGDSDIPSGTTLRGTMVNNPPSNGQNLGVADIEDVSAGANAAADWGGGAGTEEAVSLSAALRPQLGGNYDQDRFRARNDDGDETDATWKADLNIDWNQEDDINVRVRFGIEELDDVEELDVEFRLQYNKNSGGWNDVDASSTNVRSSASPNVTDGIDTTEQLGMPGTFVTPNAGFDEVDGVVGGSSLDFTTTVNQEVELEFCFQVRGVDTADNDTIQLRVVKEDGTVLGTYTNTPTMTIFDDLYHIAGISRDFSLDPLGNVRCILLKQDGAAEASRIYTIIAHQNSDGSGNYDFRDLTDNDAQYMVIGYNDVATDVRGVTNDTLTPVSQ